MKEIGIFGPGMKLILELSAGIKTSFFWEAKPQ